MGFSPGTSAAKADIQFAGDRGPEGPRFHGGLKGETQFKASPANNLTQ